MIHTHTHTHTHTCSLTNHSLLSVDDDDEVIIHWTEDGTNYSRSQRELAESAKEDPKDQKNLDYFRAQLELFSKMCFGRQYLAILRVKEQLPIDVVLRYMYMHVYVSRTRML